MLTACTTVSAVSFLPLCETGTVAEGWTAQPEFPKNGALTRMK